MSKGDSTKRKVLYEIADRFQDHFIRNSIRLLPVYVIEHFKKEYEKIDVIEPDQKSFHLLQLRFTEYDSLFVAKYVEQGSKLYWYQDGQETAELAYKYARHYQYNVADQFRTWGWKQREKDTSWKAYPLLKFRTKYEKIQNSGKYDLMLCYPLLNDENKTLYKKNTENMLQNLKPEKNFNILARPYPVSRKQSNEGQLRFIKDERVTVSTGLTPMVQEMSECRLIIQMEIPSTNFMECIFVSHPGAGLIVNNQPTEMIKPYYDALTELGIFHYTMDSMVQFLNQTDIDEWWESIITHEKMIEFKNTFASETIPGK
jgi:putative transferase (TIGR04331 family)